MRLGKKVKGLSCQLAMIELHHNWSIDKPFDFSEEKKKYVDPVTKPIEKAVSNVAKEAAKAVDVITPDITIAKKDQSLKGIGKAVTEVGAAAYDVTIGLGTNALKEVDRSLLNNNIDKFTNNALTDLQSFNSSTKKAARAIASGDGGKMDDAFTEMGRTAGNIASVAVEYPANVLIEIDRSVLNGNVDIYSGGLLSDIKNIGGIYRDLGEGKPVDDNLKSMARVGAITAAYVLSGGTAAAMTMLSTAGMSQASWGQVVDNIADAYLPSGLGDIFEGIIDGPKQVTEYNTTYTPSDAGNPIVLQDVVDSKVIPIMVATVVLATAIILLKKKKK